MSRGPLQPQDARGARGVRDRHKAARAHRAGASAHTADTERGAKLCTLRIARLKAPSRRRARHHMRALVTSGRGLACIDDGRVITAARCCDALQAMRYRLAMAIPLLFFI
eukprot:6204482-Pleurochrysis_carterae.AAC.1